MIILSFVIITAFCECHSEFDSHGFQQGYHRKKANINFRSHLLLSMTRKYEFVGTCMQNLFKSPYFYPFISTFDMKYS